MYLSLVNKMRGEDEKDGGFGFYGLFFWEIFVCFVFKDFLVLEIFVFVEEGYFLIFLLYI